MLPFDPRELVAMRVRPAQFATMCSVSRQTVSQWTRKGWITPGPDGLIDPIAATRQLLQRANPARIRARIFREATESLGQLRARVLDLERALAKERERGESREAAARAAVADDVERRLVQLTDALRVRFDAGCAAYAAGGLATWMDELVAVHFYGWDLAEYRELIGEDGESCPG